MIMMTLTISDNVKTDLCPLVKTAYLSKVRKFSAKN